VSQIFISYVREDQTKAKALVRRFEQEGWEIWWDQELIPGEVRDDRIQKSVDEAQCVIVLWSKESVQSEWVRAEAREARRQKKLIPILLDQVKLPMPFFLIQSGKLVGWTGDPDDPGLAPLVAAVNKRLGGKSRVVLPPEVAAERWGQLKTKTTTLAMLVLPALLTGLAGWGTMNWKVPTKVEVSLWTSHVDFTIRPTASSSNQLPQNQHSLLDPIPVTFIQFEHVSAMTVVADSLEEFVDAQAGDPVTALEEQSWRLLEESHGQVVFQPARPGAVPIMQVEFFKKPGEKPGQGSLEALTIEGGTDLALSIAGVTGDQLTIDAWGKTMGARVTVPQEFLLDVRNVARQSYPNGKKRVMKDDAYRVRVQRANGRLQIEGEPEERMIQKPSQKVNVSGRRLIMTLGLATTTSIPMFGKEVVALETIRFLEGEDRLGKVQAPDIFEGQIVLPQHAEQKQISIGQNDILVLENLEEDFHLQSLQRDPQHGALYVKAVGTVGGIRLGNAIDKQDLRLTAFERLQGDQKLMMLGGLMVVMFTTTLGGWRVWKELAR